MFKFKAKPERSMTSFIIVVKGQSLDEQHKTGFTAVFITLVMSKRPAIWANSKQHLKIEFNKSQRNLLRLHYLPLNASCKEPENAILHKMAHQTKNWKPVSVKDEKPWNSVKPGWNGKIPNLKFPFGIMQRCSETVCPETVQDICSSRRNLTQSKIIKDIFQGVVTRRHNLLILQPEK